MIFIGGGSKTRFKCLGELRPGAQEVIGGHMLVPTKCITCEIEDSKSKALIWWDVVVCEIVFCLEDLVKWV